MRKILNYLDKEGLRYLIAKIKNEINNKVDKVDGKTLSTNDFTTAEKEKLAGIDANANKYVLPVASATTLGGIKVGTNLTIKDGVLAAKDTTYGIATASSAGLLSTTGYNKLSKVTETEMGFLSGVSSSIQAQLNSRALLDSNGKIISSQLPSYVDDVLEYTSKSNFPSTGETGKIYVDTSTNLTYRWSGSSYIEISPSLALGTTSSTAFRGDYGNTAYNHAIAKGSAFSSGLYKITTNEQGHVIAATAVTKSDITALGIPGQDTNTTYSVMSGATSGAGGAQGLVPAPAAGKQASFLRGDGTWAIPTNTTYGLATSSSNGLLSSSDFTKLSKVTATEMGYLSGVTSSLQTQLQQKVEQAYLNNLIIDWDESSIRIWTQPTGIYKIKQGTKIYYNGISGTETVTIGNYRSGFLVITNELEWQMTIGSTTTTMPATKSWFLISGSGDYGYLTQGYTHEDSGSHYGSKVINKLITYDNTISYTPTSDYHPANKKYVDDKTITIVKVNSITQRKGIISGKNYVAGNDIKITLSNITSASQLLDKTLCLITSYVDSPLTQVWYPSTVTYDDGSRDNDYTQLVINDTIKIPLCGNALVEGANYITIMKSGSYTIAFTQSEPFFDKVAKIGDVNFASEDEITTDYCITLPGFSSTKSYQNQLINMTTVYNAPTEKTIPSTINIYDTNYALVLPSCPVVNKTNSKTIKKNEFYQIYYNTTDNKLYIYGGTYIDNEEELKIQISNLKALLSLGALAGAAASAYTTSASVGSTNYLTTSQMADVFKNMKNSGRALLTKGLEAFDYIKDNTSKYYLSNNVVIRNLNVMHNACLSYSSSWNNLIGDTESSITTTARNNLRTLATISYRSIITSAEEYIKYFETNKVKVDFDTYAYSSDTYTFSYDSTNKYYKSGNAGNANSFSRIRVYIAVRPGYTATVKFDCNCYSELNFDYGIVGNLDQTLTGSYSAESTYNTLIKSSDNTFTTVTFTVPEGRHYVEFKYRKDSSQNSNNDEFRIKLNSFSTTKNS